MSDQQPVLTRLGLAAVASLIPWAAFVAVTWFGDRSTSISHEAAAALSLLAFVALPSALPVAVARARSLRLVAVAVMTAVAAIAGIAMTASDDAQAGLALLWVPLVALPLAAVIWVGERVAASRAAELQPGASELPEPATLADRLAALAIDATIVGAALVAPLTALSHAKHEVTAVVVGVAAATAYFAGLVATRGQTVGQAVLKLTVVDARTSRRLPLSRAVIRSLIVVLEVAAVPTVMLSPAAIAEAIAVQSTGRSLTDRLLGTAVIRSR